MSEPFLRPAVAEDCGLIAGWLSDPAINAMLSSNLRGAQVSAQALMLGLRRRDQSWMLFAPDAAAMPAGLIALDSVDTVDGIANLWFLLGTRDFGGRGLTSAAIARFCRDNPAGLHVLTAWIVDGNTASVRCLEKAGFHPAGRIEQGVAFAGGRRDRILMQRIVGTMR